MNKQGKRVPSTTGVDDLVTTDAGKVFSVFALPHFSPSKSSKPLCCQTTSSKRRLSHGSLEKSQPIQGRGIRREALTCASWYHSDITHYQLWKLPDNLRQVFHLSSKDRSFLAKVASGSIERKVIWNNKHRRARDKWCLTDYVLCWGD